MFFFDIYDHLGILCLKDIIYIYIYIYIYIHAVLNISIHPCIHTFMAANIHPSIQNDASVSSYMYRWVLLKPDFLGA